MQVYDEPTVLLAKRVTGEEEVPEGCVAVVTPDAPDVLSHVSVRARNMRVLFAICHESGPLQEIENLAGKVLTYKLGPRLLHKCYFRTCCHHPWPVHEHSQEPQTMMPTVPALLVVL